MIFYKKTNDSGNVWAFNMTYFFIVFILKKREFSVYLYIIFKFQNAKYTLLHSSLGVVSE
ncbi:hypothetical protein COJ50_20115 [Bacillus cereus]|uniref:Uncharacterized protein n=1 Tax=Bacillus cereus TaxID=1396 RepID=A0A2B1KCG9_BACCE|nr:hypothetical protein COJ50_20115 [Bacillus cereus]